MTLKSRRALVCVLVASSQLGCTTLRNRVKCWELSRSAPPAGSTVPAQSFSSPEGRFKIGLPPARPYEPESSDTADGHATTRYRWLVLNHGEYEITYTDSDNLLEDEANSKRIFDNVRDLLLSKGAGKLESDVPLHLANHPGREIRIKDPYGGTNVRRVYLVAHRMYTVGVFVPSALECLSGPATKALDSFELIEDE